MTTDTTYRVAVLGGGMAGLAAAHELASVNGDGPVRFDVTVYERNATFGKLRALPPKIATTCPASTASASSPATTATCRTP